MAFKTSAPDPEPWPGPRVEFGDYAARLSARRAELGDPEIPRNPGDRRTPSKRALLEAIERVGGKW